MADDGGIKSFDCLGSSTTLAQKWQRWLRGFEYYLGSTGIKDATRKRDTLLHKAGLDVQDVFHSLPTVEPTEEQDVYTATVAALTKKFTPKGNVPYERIKFRSMSQEQSETVDQFEMRLRRQAEYCNFDKLIDEQLRDQILDKVFSRELKRKLIEIGPDMTLQSVLDTARCWEDANLKERELSSLPDKLTSVCEVREGSRARFNAKQLKCFACGYKGHVRTSANCPALREKCRLCQRIGHFQACCKQAKKEKKEETKGFQKKKKPTKKKVATLQDSSSEESDYTFGVTVGQLNSVQSEDLFRVKVGGVNLKVMIDSGASCNVVDENTWSFLKKQKILCSTSSTSKMLYPYGNKEPLSVLGKFCADVEVRNKKESAVFYVIKGRGSPLLGKETATKLGVLTIGLPVNQIENLQENAKGSNVKKKTIGKLKNFQMKLPVKDGVVPVYQPLRRIPVPLQKKLEEQLDELEELDIIEKVNGPSRWASQLVTCPKRNGDLRICVDMRRANESIEREKHHIPSFEEILPDLRDSVLFSKLDFNSAFHQIELSPESREITTFLTHRGLYRYKRLMFGVNCAPEMFQRTMEQVLRGCEGTHVYMDDVLVHGRTKEEHDERLNKVLKALEEKGMTLNTKKCLFGVDAVDFIGHRLTSNGVTVTDSKVEAVKNFREPKTPAEVSSFLGLVNFVGRFIPNLSTETEPLRRLLKKEVPFEWGSEQKKAFNVLKRRLTEKRTLGYYNPEAKTTVIADASPVGLGAVLVQDGPGGPKVISYASKSLSDSEKRYSQNEKEALALVWACERFHYFLYGREFDLVTDNKPIETIFSPKGKSCARIERWVMRMQAYKYRVIHKPGKSNIADPLSRLLPNCSTNDSFDREEERCLQVLLETATPVALKLGDVEEAFEEDDELQAVSQSLKTGTWEPASKAFQPFAMELSQVGHAILKGTRLVIPKPLRQHTLELAHEGHPGITKMKQRLRSKVWWPGIDKDCERSVKNCHGCQLVGTPNHPEPMKRTTLPPGPWQDLAIDFMGPLPSGHSLLVIVDYYSRFYEVEIMKKTTAQKTIERLKPIFARFGLPLSIRSDNGPQFQSDEFFKDFCAQNKIEHLFTTPLWPQANGEVERQNKSLLKRLKIAQATGKDWKEEMLKYLVCYRNTPHSTTAVSPAELLFKMRPRDKIPLYEEHHLIDDDLRDLDQERKWKGKEYADRTRNAQDSRLEEGDLVLMRQPGRNKLTTTYNPIPNTVVKKNGSCVTVRTPDNATYKRNSTFFKKYHQPVPSPPKPSVAEFCSRTAEPERELPGVVMGETMQEHSSSSLESSSSTGESTSANSATPQRTRPERVKRLPQRYQD